MQPRRAFKQHDNIVHALAVHKLALLSSAMMTPGRHKEQCCGMQGTSLQASLSQPSRTDAPMLTSISIGTLAEVDVNCCSGHVSWSSDVYDRITATRSDLSRQSSLPANSTLQDQAQLGA